MWQAALEGDGPPDGYMTHRCPAHMTSIAARFPEAVDTSTCHLGFRGVVRPAPQR